LLQLIDATWLLYDPSGQIKQRIISFGQFSGRISLSTIIVKGSMSLVLVFSNRGAIDHFPIVYRATGIGHEWASSLSDKIFETSEEQCIQQLRR
jgi:hypothetical protein